MTGLSHYVGAIINTLGPFGLIGCAVAFGAVLVIAAKRNG